ncbi:ABC transporter permease [Enterococcus rotai]|uniref:ABC transporter permease n=1 Tax=Enterococcus rotai TaxID=118060 RepID=UPI0032B3DBFA
MIHAMKAENYKFIHSKTWKIALLICTIFSIFIMLSSSKSDWKKELLDYNETIEKDLGMTSEEIEHSKKENSQIKQWKVNTAYLTSNKRAATQNTFQGYMSSLLALKMLGLILVVFPILFAVQIAKEYETGTIKYMLISPHSRIQLAMGKYLTILFASFLFLLAIFAINFFLSYFLLEKSSDTFFYMSQGQITSMNVYGFMLKNTLLSLVYYLSYLTLAFMLSLLFRSTTVSLSLSLFCALLGTQLIGLINIPIRFKQLLLIAIVDLTHTENSLSIVEQNNYSLLSCLIIIFIYVGLFLAISLNIFKRQDI